MPETGFFRGAGGGIFEMSLPLPEIYEEQVTRGQLTRVNADGSPYEAAAETEVVEVPAEGGPAGDPPADERPAMDLVEGTIRRPGVNASKNEWVGYAVSQGMSVDDADAMTKADLIEKLK